MVSLQKSAFDMNKGYSLFTERFHEDRVIVSDLLRIWSFARTPENTLIYRHLVVYRGIVISRCCLSLGIPLVGINF
jgi:hypothetical protein